VKAQQRESFARALADMELLLRTQPLVSVNRAQLTQAGSIALIDSVVKKMREREPSGRLVLDIPVTATSLRAISSRTTTPSRSPPARSPSACSARSQAPPRSPIATA
jgi:hypothetical protein